jgi:hypothetical protein
MSAALLLVTELPVDPAQIDHAEKAWLGLSDLSQDHQRLLFRHEDNDSLLELAVLTGWEDVAVEGATRADQWHNLAPYATGDFRRQILELVEEPKPPVGELPDTDQIQMRYVEVKPAVYGAYRAWREETIFDVVRNAPEIESFSAYHTAISTQPGVMFVSGFNVDVDAYRAVFSSERYRGIVQAAGDNYITGGNNGLLTKIYTRARAARSRP